MDLVEIAPLAKPPVCKLMDYGKFRYREQKKAHEAKLKQKQIQVKEIKFRPGTDEGDYKIKLRQADPVPRGRRQGEGDAAFPRPRDGAQGVRCAAARARAARIWMRCGLVEQFPKLEGRQMVMVLAPKKKGAAGEEGESGKAGSRTSRKAAGAAEGCSKARRRLARRRTSDGRGYRSVPRSGPPGVIAKRERTVMPKMKSKSGAAKRFKVRAQRQHQARRRLQAPHPHQEDHQAQAPDARAAARWTRPTRRRSVRCCRTRPKERAMPRVKRGVTARARHKKVLKRPRASAAAARTSTASPSRR